MALAPLPLVLAVPGALALLASATPPPCPQHRVAVGRIRTCSDVRRLGRSAGRSADLQGGPTLSLELLSACGQRH